MLELCPIAHIHTEFPSKFGVPRQSGIVEALQGQVVFLPQYRNPHAFRGLEGFSHIWLLWQFSQTPVGEWSPTVRPPRLGGNARMGVFATRSPFRPNPIGLSCVRLEKIDFTAPNAPVLHVAGADLVDGTPIFDVKPYLPYVDAHPQARGGFALSDKTDILQVQYATPWPADFPAEKQAALHAVLAQDPRPGYLHAGDAARLYGFPFCGFEIRFTVEADVLTVREIEKI